jgi:CheY-like chemotaxis protein
MKKEKKYRVLIVDDEQANIMILNSILESRYTIYAATCGADAIDAAKEHLPDIIVLDIIMPDMDGYEVLLALKSNEQTMHIPIIFISSLSGVGSEERGLALGAADYITKPFSPSVVKLRIRNQVNILKHSITEYDLLKYKLTSKILKVAPWDMKITVEDDPLSPLNEYTWSQEYRELLGYEGENDFPDNLDIWRERCHPDDISRVIEAFSAHVTDYSGKTPFDIQYRLKNKNGEYKLLRAFCETMRDSDGTPLKVAGATMDITGT